MGDFRRRWIASAGLVAGLLCLPAGAAADQPAQPSCTEGPLRSGGTIVGTPCADHIVVPASVARVEAGPGNDTIIAAPGTAAAQECSGGCFGGIGSQTIEGGAGNDLIFGQRGNDTLRGGPGDDSLFGGIGDDKLEGGSGDDFLSGGFGADAIDGQEGSDTVRGDGTVDQPLRDTGSAGVDTLSYATGITPGFADAMTGFTYPDFTEYAGFPSKSGERGVYLNLADGHGDNGIAASGGGVDRIEGQGFERIVGSPFADYIVGTAASESIYGGGGADVIRGEGGNDRLFGGADGDDLDGDEGSDSADGGLGGTNRCQGVEVMVNCESTATKAVAPRIASQVSAGFMVPSGETGAKSALYVVGSAAGDTITATYEGSKVTVALTGAGFDAESNLNGCTFSGGTATCTLPAGSALDSVVIAGMGGDDTLVANGFPVTVSPILIGGEGADTITGGDSSEDVLVDGPGNFEDKLTALGGDDALLHNDGPDILRGGNGNDLFLSVSICDGEHLFGEANVDNSSWARLNGVPVAARLDQGIAGQVGPAGTVTCSSGGVDSMSEIEDLEGSNQDDTLVGNSANNQLLGHFGEDTLLALAGDDTILANSEDTDALIDCGEGSDLAVIDIPHPPQYVDPAPIGCEKVREGKPDEFEAITELPPVVEPPPPPPPVDRKPPRTKITKRPARLLTTGAHPLRVVFRFAASEGSSTFRCKLDAKPYRPCSSPRAFMVRPGRHAVRIFAIDAAGNRDQSPALIRFRVRRR